MYFKFQNLKNQATVQTKSIPTHECTMRLAPGQKFTPSVKKMQVYYFRFVTLNTIRIVRSVSSGFTCKTFV